MTDIQTGSPLFKPESLLMRCSKCHSEELERMSADEIVCKGCGTHFKTSLNIFYIH